MRNILLPTCELWDAIARVEKFIIETLPSYAEGAVLGMSGGIDSSVVAALTSRAFFDHNKAIGHEVEWGAPRFPKPLKLRGYGLPTNLNTPEDVLDAARVAEMSSIPFTVVDLAPMIEADEKNLPVTLSKYDRGNMISRHRANVLWTLAAHYRCIVMGTGNKDEDYGVGYYTLLGDGAVYMNPIGCFSKRMVRSLGRALGLPEDLIKRTPTAGLEPNQTDAGDLGYSYEFVELVIEGLAQGFMPKDLVQHPQIQAEFDRGRSVGVHGGYQDAVFDVIHRHEIAKKKAAYICPKIPTNIAFKYVSPEEV